MDWEAIKKYLLCLATDRVDGVIPACIKFFLFLLSIVYVLAVVFLIHICRFFQLSLGCRVISVGNITLGGTGKTTLVAYIAEVLKSEGHKVAIISRGYKKPTTPDTGNSSDYAGMGDEPFMLQEKLKDIPVIVDRDRFRAGKKAVQDYGVDSVILDDGMQQWRLKKDLEIVAVDATNPFGNRCLLPRGILRQPIFSLQYADIFVLTKTNFSQDVAKIKEELHSINPGALIVESFHSPVGFYDILNPHELLGKESLKGLTVTVFSGIGDPVSFKETVNGLGITVGLSFDFPDHHGYTQKEIDEIIDSSRERKIETLITTEKDSARLAHSGINYRNCKVLVLRIQIIIRDDEKVFSRRLRSIYTI